MDAPPLLKRGAIMEARSLSRPQIVVTVEGGVIQDIEFPPGLPALRVVVKDFDIDGVEDSDPLEINDAGDGYIRSDYENDAPDIAPGSLRDAAAEALAILIDVADVADRDDERFKPGGRGTVAIGQLQAAIADAGEPAEPIPAAFIWGEEAFDSEEALIESIQEFCATELCNADAGSATDANGDVFNIAITCELVRPGARPDAITSDDGLDSFLDDMAHALANAWNERGGGTLSNSDLYKLNDVLTAHFASKRP
jgi:hypothetical protein